MTYDELYSKIKEKQSYLCIGLDSDPARIPDCVRNEQYPIFAFNRAIIDATAEYAVAFKPNTAFYEAEGVQGWAQLEMTTSYLHDRYPDIFIIADAKRGDIGNTAKRYARAFFETLCCDAVTLAPYMGRDSVAPFLAYADKWSIVLALTSNTSSSDFETLRIAGNRQAEIEEQPLFEKVLSETMKWGNKDNLMFVAGATKADMFTRIRSICPDNFLLVPGVGAQGGSVEEVSEKGINDHCGLLINSSRGIIFADNSSSFASKAASEAKKIATSMKSFL
ncbi:MAG: orotidine-5'-phosphate decarboxylase [Clostridiales bacterium]|nr:orotidine-5'-phosphate decarboxylase [Clostridiales bacterium]